MADGHWQGSERPRSRHVAEQNRVFGVGVAAGKHLKSSPRESDRRFDSQRAIQRRVEAGALPDVRPARTALSASPSCYSLAIAYEALLALLSNTQQHDSLSDPSHVCVRLSS